MTSDTRPRFLRTPWTVPAVVAVAVAAAIVTPPLLASANNPDLPTISTEDLLVRVAEAEPQPLAGTVVHTARLGLPEIPFAGPMGAEPLALIGGSSTLRVWTDAADRSRVALLGDMSEYSAVRDGAEAWTYSSTDDEVVHYTLSPADLARHEAMAQDLRADAIGVGLPTPAEAAREALALADEHSVVTQEEPAMVAGRSAYQVVVTPRGEGTLVDRIVVAIDGETATPLRVQVWSVQDEAAPSLEIGFTDIEFRMPDDAVLTFTPPAGATVREVEVALPDHEMPGLMPGTELPQAPTGLPGITGTGWQTVVTVPGLDLAALLGTDPAELVGAMPDRLIGSDEAQDLIGEFMADEDGPGMQLDPGALFEQFTTEVPEGRLLTSTLFSVLVTPDGVLFGAVPPETLRGMA